MTHISHTCYSKQWYQICKVKKAKSALRPINYCVSWLFGANRSTDPPVLCSSSLANQISSSSWWHAPDQLARASETCTKFASLPDTYDSANVNQAGAPKHVLLQGLHYDHSHGGPSTSPFSKRCHMGKTLVHKFYCCQNKTLENNNKRRYYELPNYTCWFLAFKVMRACISAHHCCA